MKHINAATVIALILSAGALVLVIFKIALNGSMPLACRIFSSTILIPCEGILTFIFGDELINELR